MVSGLHGDRCDIILCVFWRYFPGRLYQVEYAMEAIGHAGTCLGILANDGVLLAAERRNIHKLLDEVFFSEKIYKLNEWVNEHGLVSVPTSWISLIFNFIFFILRDMACSVAGITSDANVLTNELRLIAQRLVSEEKLLREKRKKIVCHMIICNKFHFELARHGVDVLPGIYCSIRSRFPASSWWRPSVTSSRPTHSSEVTRPVNEPTLRLNEPSGRRLTVGFVDRKEAVRCVSAVHGLGQTLRLPAVPERPQRQLWGLEGDVHRQQQRCKSDSWELHVKTELFVFRETKKGANSHRPKKKLVFLHLL